MTCDTIFSISRHLFHASVFLAARFSQSRRQGKFSNKTDVANFYCVFCGSVSSSRGSKSGRHCFGDGDASEKTDAALNSSLLLMSARACPPFSRFTPVALFKRWCAEDALNAGCPANFDRTLRCSCCMCILTWRRPRIELRSAA